MFVYYAIFAIFGLCLGSFANVLIARLPKGQNIAFPASHCPKCKKALKFYHNIPIISYFVLGGKCAFCKSKISIKYPLIEALGAVLSVFAFYLSSKNILNLEQITSTELVNIAFLTLCFVFLLALSAIDFKCSAVPESLLIFAYFFAIMATFSSFEALFSYESPLVISLIFMGGIFIIKSALSAWMNRKKSSEIVESMGEADVIIFGIIGALCGVKLGFYAIMLACVLQLIFHLILSKKSKEAPFIPSLFLGLLGILVAQRVGIFDV